MPEQKPHSEHLAAFKAWALAEKASPYADWHISRAEARELFEQLEAAQAEESFQFNRAERGFAEVRRLNEQLEAAQHERSVACDWAAELAGEKRALQASVEIIQQERDGLLAQVRDHCSRPPGVCYPARKLAPSESRDKETGGSLVGTPDPTKEQDDG